MAAEAMKVSERRATGRDEIELNKIESKVRAELDRKIATLPLSTAAQPTWKAAALDQEPRRLPRSRASRLRFATG